MIKIMLTYQARGREGLPCHQREQLESLTGAQQPHRKQQQQQRGRDTNSQLSSFGKTLVFTNHFETRTSDHVQLKLGMWELLNFILSTQPAALDPRYPAAYPESSFRWANTQGNN